MKTHSIYLKFSLSLFLLWALFLFPASAIVFNFVQVSNNGETPIASQLSMDVTNPNVGQALFTMSNSGPVASSISNIFFDDAASMSFLDSIISIINTPWLGGNPVPSNPNVDFLDASGQGNFGTEVTGFVDTFHFKAGPPPSKSGIDPGESLGLLFQLSAGKTFAGLINSLFANGPDDFRVGLHVISIAGAGSEKYINTGGDEPGDFVIPEPTSMLLMLGGILGLFHQRRKKA